MLSFLSRALVPCLAATGRALAAADDGLSATLGIEGSKVEALARRAFYGVTRPEQKKTQAETGLGLS